MVDVLAREIEQLVALFARLRKLAFDLHPSTDSGVTMAQLTLLDWVAASPGCSVQDVATGLGLTAPTVSATVRRLEEAALLERQPDPQDGRAVQLFLTAGGQALHEKMRAFRHNKIASLLVGLTSEERATLMTLLERALHSAETRQASHHNEGLSVKTSGE